MPGVSLLPGAQRIDSVSVVGGPGGSFNRLNLVRQSARISKYKVT